jgi:hypothetical protein
MAFTKDLMARFLCWHIQEQAFGRLDARTAKLLDGFARGERPTAERRLKPGTVLVREYQSERHTVTVVPGGYVWHETTYASLSTHRTRHHRHSLERPSVLRAAHLRESSARHRV